MNLFLHKYSMIIAKYLHKYINKIKIKISLNNKLKLLILYNQCLIIKPCVFIKDN